MKRRTLLTGMCALVGTRVLPVNAQARVPRVAFLIYGRGAANESRIRTFRDGLKALGYVDGRNVLVDLRGGQLSREVTDRLATELVASKPDVIVAQGYAIRAAVARTKSIPIVCVFSGDLVEAGLVKSLARPGGNLTGIQLMALDLVGKRIELVKELLPKLARIAVIADPQHAGEHLERDVSLKAAARLGIQVSYHPVKSFEEYAAALPAARASGAEALVLFPDTITNNRTELTAAFALKHRLATVAGWDNYADAGQLISYGPNLRATWGRLAYYVDRVLKGADPATLPVELPAVFELVVNLGTARALGVTIPPSILLRADRVIE